METEALARDLKDVLVAAGYQKVRDVVIDRGRDSTGEDALFIWLLLDDAVPSRSLDWDAVQPLIEEARRRMRALQPEFYPYVRVRRQREWQELQASELTPS